MLRQSQSAREYGARHLEPENLKELKRHLEVQLEGLRRASPNYTAGLKRPKRPQFGKKGLLQALRISKA